MTFPNNMLTVIYTVDRTENYLAQTIADLKDAGIKNGVISQGSISDNNLRSVGAVINNFFVDYPKPVVGDNDFESRSVRYKAQINYINAFRTPARNYQYRLILEDDVRASKRNTLPVLASYLKTAERMQRGRPFILSLYTPYIFNQDKITVLRINTDGFYGTQACVFSEVICGNFARFIEERIETKPHDFLLKDFCKENGINLYGATRSLFQHTGVTTTGLGHHHTTENFIGD